MDANVIKQFLGGNFNFIINVIHIQRYLGNYF